MKLTSTTNLCARVAARSVALLSCIAIILTAAHRLPPILVTNFQSPSSSPWIHDLTIGFLLTTLVPAGSIFIFLLLQRGFVFSAENLMLYRSKSSKLNDTFKQLLSIMLGVSVGGSALYLYIRDVFQVMLSDNIIGNLGILAKDIGIKLIFISMVTALIATVFGRIAVSSHLKFEEGES